jgi:hypothetical protein
VGLYTSITIGSDGLGLISYYEETNDNWGLKVAHCSDIVCSKATTTVVDTDGEVGTHTSITNGTDGQPIISYYDITTQGLKVTHCSNPFCVPYWRRR